MKKTTHKILITLAVVGLSQLLSCNGEQFNDYLENLTDGVVINVNTDIFAIPMAVEVVNSNPLSERQPDNLKVTIDGPSKDIIYSPDGSKEIKIVDGFMSNLQNK